MISKMLTLHSTDPTKTDSSSSNVNPIENENFQLNSDLNRLLNPLKRHVINLIHITTSPSPKVRKQAVSTQRELIHLRQPLIPSSLRTAN